MNKGLFTNLISILQVLSSLLMSWLLGYTLMSSIDNDLSNHLEILTGFFPLFLLLILTVFPIFILRLKHRVAAAEGPLLPLYLFFITMSSASFLPRIEDYIGITIFSFVFVQRLSFFFLLSTEIVLFFASLVNYDNGKNLKHSNMYTTLGLLTTFVLSATIPLNSNYNVANSHSTGLLFIAIAIMLLALLTYFANFLKDKESYALKRFITFVFLSIGHIVILTGIFPFSIFGLILYTVGILMLCFVSPNGY
ncbi:MAG: hypothetical protein K6G51_02145 [Sphaerochaetaceae bacterium]|nr:hypothetical protein [Sphaerochaetaceae bacterium]